MKVVFGFLFLLVGCASQQIPFQKNSNGIGYTIEQKNAANFIVKTSLPADFGEKSTKKYVARAVGEQCSENGFNFFDFTDPVNGAAEGFCFKENKRKALAITFNHEGLKQSPPVFVVENLNQKSDTKLLLGDKVNRVNDKEVTSVAELKRFAFHSGNKSVSSVKIELERNGKVVTVAEPLADMSNGAYTSTDLETLRKIIQ